MSLAAAEMMADVDASSDQQRQAAALARGAIEARPSDHGRRQLVEELGGQSPALALALAGEPEALGQTLAALNQGENTPANRAFVEYAFSATKAEAYADEPALGDGMADALARHGYPDDPARQAREAERFRGILATDQGRDLLAGGSEGIPPQARAQMLAVLRDNPALDAAALQSHDDSLWTSVDDAGWTQPAVMKIVAQERASQFLEARGDAPVALPGTHLENTVGFAMGYPSQGIPEHETAAQTAEREARFSAGDYSYYRADGNSSTEEQNRAEAVSRVAASIRELGGDNPEVTVLPVQFSNPETGPVQLSLFRVQGEDGQARFVDNTGRQYDNFDEWRTNNELPPGNMTYPADGELRRDANGEVMLESENTPETVDSFGEWALGAADTAALVGGIAAGGVLIAATAGLATPFVAGAATVVAGGASLWGASRSAVELYDRYDHGQSINLFTDAEARGEWLNFGANALGVGALGATARVAQLAQAGQAVSPLAATAAATLQVGANVADGAAMLDTGYTLLSRWDELPPESRTQMGLSMAFYGVMGAASTKMSGTSFADSFNINVTRNQLMWDSPVPVVQDADLPGRTVEVHYNTNDSGLNEHIHIKAGPDATAEDIRLHSETAQLLRRNAGLEGRMRNWIGNHGEPPTGSKAYEAKLEIEKLPRVIESRLNELAGTTDPAARARIEASLADLDAQLQSHRQTLDSFDANPGMGFVAAADNTGRPATDIGNAAHQRTAENPKFEFRYTADEIEAIVAQGQQLGLTDRAIEDLIFVGSRVDKALNADQLMAQMNNYANEVLPRGYPYRFDSKQDFGEFETALLDRIDQVGLPMDDVIIQGSSLRKPEAGDIDIAIMMDQETFNVKPIDLFNGRVKINGEAIEVTPDNLAEIVAKIRSDEFDKPRDQRGFNAPARSLRFAYDNLKIRSQDVPGLDAGRRQLQANWGDIDLSIMSRAGEFDLEPTMKLNRN